MNPPFGFVRSFVKSGSRLNSLRFTPLRQTPLFPWIFLPSLTGFKRGLKIMKRKKEI
jgi:hypothetical protein